MTLESSAAVGDIAEAIYGRDEYYGNGYRRSPPPMYRDTRDYPSYRDTRDYSPHRDARDYYESRGGRGYSDSPNRSPYGGRARRERSRSLQYSPYRMPERGYGRRGGGGGYDRFAAFAWTIWKCRNKGVIEKSFIKQPLEVVFNIVSCLQRWRILLRKNDQQKLDGLLDVSLDWLKNFRSSNF